MYIKLIKDCQHCKRSYENINLTSDTFPVNNTIMGAPSLKMMEKKMYNELVDELIKL